MEDGAHPDLDPLQNILPGLLRKPWERRCPENFRMAPMAAATLPRDEIGDVVRRCGFKFLQSMERSPRSFQIDQSQWNPGNLCKGRDMGGRHW